ncbi:MAG: erythromycin esterase family protein [Anaerolineae bacterium]
MNGHNESRLVEAVRNAALPLENLPEDLSPVLDWIDDASIVLLGEATHGTHDFYRTRALLTRRLIAEKDFCTVAVEADWPDANRVGRYVLGIGDGTTGIESLSGFERFPAWMWCNVEVLEFINWLKAFNRTAPTDAEKVGFFGLDLYSLRASSEAVIRYLETKDPAAAQRARYRYACFDQFGEDPHAYGYAAAFGLDAACESEVVQQLVELSRSANALVQQDGSHARDEFFFAEQNARLVRNVEEYYRAQFAGRVSSWNLRDRHMAETLDALLDYDRQRRGNAKVVVWAHNSHLSDARASEMADRGELNLGQLLRERHGSQVMSVGFTTYSGTVTAASNWGSAAERMWVRPALAESYEAVLHETLIPRFALSLREDNDAVDGLRQPRLERAIGVVYRPHSERLSHYLRVVLPGQFDALVHIDHTQALEPLDRSPEWEKGELPEMLPFEM